MPAARHSSNTIDITVSEFNTIAQMWSNARGANNYTNISLGPSRPSGKEGLIGNKGIIPKFQVEHGRVGNIWHRVIRFHCDSMAFLLPLTVSAKLAVRTMNKF